MFIVSPSAFVDDQRMVYAFNKVMTHPNPHFARVRYVSR